MAIASMGNLCKRHGCPVLLAIQLSAGLDWSPDGGHSQPSAQVILVAPNQFRCLFVTGCSGIARELDPESHAILQVQRERLTADLHRKED